MEPKEAYAVAVLLRGKLENLGFLKEDNIRVAKY
jgi:hypothetical protein